MYKALDIIQRLTFPLVSALGTPGSNPDADSAFSDLNSSWFFSAWVNILQ